MIAAGSSNQASRMSEDANTSSNSCASPVFTLDRDNLSGVPPVSNLQPNDRRQLEGDSPLRDGRSPSELVDRSTTIDKLPEELMLEIFSYMSSSENINILQEVCTRWKTLAQSAQLWIHEEYVIRYDAPEEEAIATFAAVPQLRTVILQKEVSPGVFEALSRSCPHLTSLQMSPRQMLTYSEAENLFNGCREIRTLTISDRGLRADTRVLVAVAQLPDLRALCLETFKYTEEEIPLRILAEGCPQLRDLDLERPSSIRYRIRDAEYFINSHKHVLQRLCIGWTSVEGRAISPLLVACADTLECLELYDYKKLRLEEATEALTAVGRLRSLRELHIDIYDFGVRHLVPALFESGGLANLRKLWIRGVVPDEASHALSRKCPELRELKLENCDGHTDVLFEPLCRLGKLEILHIYNCTCLCGKAMSYISKLPALHTLHFGNTDSDGLTPNVDSILEISGLRRLCIWRCVCWDIPFDEFPGRLVNLRELELNYCHGDQAALNSLCAQMPDLRVKGSLGVLITDDDEEDILFSDDEDH